ncbi:MAG: transposase [Geoalkalibacter sp.]|uniref:REP-associated tyrosine transposase n=1 Tax=Geoalkalibacter sp. TaxID=3041440 RepID=UPI003D146DB0
MDSDSPHSRDLRKGRVSLAGQTYLVTSTTLNRRPVFADFTLGRVLVNVMRDHAEKGHVESLAFVIMPDHFHWLLTLTGEYSLSKLMGQVKGAAAYQIGQISGSPCRSGFSRDELIAPEGAPTGGGHCGSRFSRKSSSRDKRIWQKGFHDRALRRDEDIRAVARYTIMNPVRAQIVSRIWNYPLWDAVWVDSSKFDPS